ncbi:2-aminoethylphosphonate ABC transporter permease subunit [Mycobacterium sp. AZCC_0083]|uniref:2-aminoethylphosphonate ABC transporter permease subunit n=1 Tax=Mycobacterium sp. AZCC_0083 TaxID=2735882 RepID=UPI001618AC08|nr:2-aminoethylphosphonate ABC transporter permease subunit [Mycobacterium sp. AZCC_0083]MBB5163420.1 2-aminoethylphosphonate transport system permease protein [Mycobacterium sp. AZCC_0083]
MTTLLDQPALDAPERPAPPRSFAAWWAVPPLVIVLIAAVYPLIRVCLESLKTGDTGSGWSNWAGVLSSEAFLDALWRTVAIAATSTVGCLILGTFLAIVLAFVPFPGSQLVGRLIDTVLALPSFLVTLAFTFLYGTAGAVNAAIAGLTGASPVLNFLYTPAGVIAAEVTFFTPFVIRPLLASFSMLPRAQLDVAASLGASPLRVLRTVMMPEAWPALMAGGSLVLLLSLNEFGIVLFTGAKGVITLPVLIYTRGIVTFDLPGAAVIATVQIALSLALYTLYRVIFGRVMQGRGNHEKEAAGDVVVDSAK